MLRCAMQDNCTNEVTHIDESGFVYCTIHAARRAGWKRTRKLTQRDLATLRAGKPIKWKGNQ